jgi:sulfur carrier protein ThiS
MSIFKNKSTKTVELKQGEETIKLEFYTFNVLDTQSFQFEDNEDVKNLLIIAKILAEKCVTIIDGQILTVDDFLELEPATLGGIVKDLVASKN